MDKMNKMVAIFSIFHLYQLREIINKLTKQQELVNEFLKVTGKMSV